MADNVIPFGGITRLDIDPDRVLTSAVGKLECVVVVGLGKDGEEYFASSMADGADALISTRSGSMSRRVIPPKGITLSAIFVFPFFYCVIKFVYLLQSNLIHDVEAVSVHVLLSHYP